MAQPASQEGDSAIIVDLSEAAMHMYTAAIDALPFQEDKKFHKRAEVVLSGMRKLRAALTDAASTSRPSSAVIVALSNVRRRYEFDLGALRPTVLEGANIEYWLEVQDGNNVTGPGVASSDRFRVRIVSEIEKRADLMNRLSDQLGAIDFVAEDQEKLSQALGAMIHGKSGGGNPATKPAGAR